MGGLEGGGLRGEEVRTYAEGDFEQKVTYPIVRLGKILYIGTLWDDSMRWIWTGVLAEIPERILGWECTDTCIYWTSLLRVEQD